MPPDAFSKIPPHLWHICQILLLQLSEITQTLVLCVMSGAADGWKQWIGLNDFLEQSNYVWVTGEAISYSNWKWSKLQSYNFIFLGEKILCE